MINAYASERHFLAHILPVWEALRDNERGTLYVGRQIELAARLGIDATPGRPNGESPVLISSFSDHKAVAPRPTILMQHGVGQSYPGDPRSVNNPSYPGGDGNGRVMLFICPNDFSALAWHARYPHIPWVVVGCPALDRWHSSPPNPNEEIIAISFHADIALIPETRSAYMQFVPALPELSKRFRLLGHGHPRIYKHLGRFYDKAGIEHTADFDEVMARASLFVCDNSSALYAFASTERPVVVLNDDRYRREITHGLRFWSHIPGLQCDRPEELAATIELALSDPPEAKRIRDAAVSYAYALRDGKAAVRAAEAIRQVVLR